MSILYREDIPEVIMNTKYARNRQVSIFALLLSIIILLIMPGNTITVEAKEASVLLTGFVKVSPADGAKDQPVSLTLKWNAAPSNPYGFGKYYKYCYFTGSGPCSFDGGLYTTQYTISGLTKGTTYYWQIQVIYCKNASCSLKEKHEADNGQVWSFKTAGTEPPGSFAKLSPTNNAMNLTSSTLSWSSSPGATSYQYCFSPNYIDTNCAFLNGWRDVGNVTSYTVPNDPNFIWGNTYYWQIRASNSGGTKLANDGVWWIFTTANLVGRATLISPTGPITESKPTYRWNHVTGIAWYYLWINSPTGNVFKQWYDATAICSGGTCAVTPDITLGSGNFTWWVQTWNSTGYGPWSSAMSFSLSTIPLPGAATPASPFGAITDTTPAYTWNTVTGATWYYLWVSKVNSDGSLTTVHSKWYESSAACSGATCSITPAGVTLNTGQYRWWIQTWNESGYGPWSSPMNFGVGAPGVATLVSPSGGITDITPTYTWNNVNASTWYYLWVSQVNGDGSFTTVHSKWYESTAVCSGATCSITPAGVTLSGGNYRWWIQTWNEGGDGPWSTKMDFSLP
jgi:hypothetical protein